MKRLFFYILILGGIIGGWSNKMNGEKILTVNRFIKSGEQGILKLDLSTMDSTLIFKVGKDSHVVNISLSPNDTLIAAIVGSGTTTQKKLVILNMMGKVKRDINRDVRVYTWSPDGNKIAFITGTYHEDGRPFIPTGVYIIDIISGKEEEIKGSPDPRRITWAKFDGNIYIERFCSYREKERIFRYNFSTKTVESTEYKGLGFSPDGKYYSHYDVEMFPSPPYRLYRTSDNKEITSQLLNTIGEDINYLGKFPPGWLKNTDHLLLCTKKEYELGEKVGIFAIIKGVRSVTNWIYDPEKNRVIKQFNGEVKWVGKDRILAVEREGKITFEEIPQE